MDKHLGKISPATLQKIVLPYSGKARQEVVSGASVGRDCGIIHLFGGLISLTSDPITGVSSDLGFFAPQVVANDLICSGADPLGILVSLILPPHTKEGEIEKIMQDINRTCLALNLSVIGGHTEISDAVNRPIVHCTGLGKIEGEFFPDPQRVEAGDVIIMTKGAGIEGTAILAREKEVELRPALGEQLLVQAQNFVNLLSVVPEGKIALRFNPHCLHDATEGGVLGAVWEVCEVNHLGFTLEESRIKVYSPTKQIARFFGLDPLRLISSGTLLIFSPDAQPIIQSLEETGIPAYLIGRVRKEKTREVIRLGGEIQEITECPPDELWRVMGD
ncbi:MAG: hypothetical protein PWP04_1424 [Candidatus Atribacteria bacterium]|nr:hypothetical protein [Candidatus Atribacteria bacterium]